MVSRYFFVNQTFSCYTRSHEVTGSRSGAQLSLELCRVAEQLCLDYPPKAKPANGWLALSEQMENLHKFAEPSGVLDPQLFNLLPWWGCPKDNGRTHSPKTKHLEKFKGWHMLISKG